MRLAVLFARARGYLSVYQKGRTVCVYLSDNRVPENVLNTLHRLTHLTLTATLHMRYFNFSNSFTGGETEAEREQGICPSFT